MVSSSASPWDPARLKAQLRLTAQRLGQLQDRKDSLAHITSNDIATLLARRNVALARTKVQNLMKEDAVSNAMEVLEMYCSLVLERCTELEKGEPKLNPPTIEAVASIIYAAAFTGSQDLILVRDMLVERLGSSFAQSALHNTDGHVSQRILHTMHWMPSAHDIDAYLQNIARKFGVDWKPPLKTDEKLSVLSGMLDASDIMGTVDLQKLRAIASSGIPVDPSWLRPRVWKLLLGTTPSMKVHWELDSQEKRESYYDLIRRLLGNVASLPLPTMPTSALDKSLLGLIDSLTRVPAHLFHGLEDEVEHSALCPIHESASTDTRIDCTISLDARLQLIQAQSSPAEDKDSSFSGTPEIRLDSGSAPSSPQEASFDLSKSARSNIQQLPKTLSLSTALAPKVFRSIPAHPSHVSALLRLLYMHKSLNPGAESPHLVSLLVPLYAVMNQEAEPVEVAHAEADTFWMFEALIREVSELEETEGGLVWMKKFRERVGMIDNELLEDLTLKGLDPTLPQYSYRWLAPVLSHTLPLPSVLMAWDAIFAQPEISRQSNPKLEHLLDICTAMLVRARARLLLLGKSGRRSPSLWDIGPSGIERQTLRPWELGDAFMEGMTLLQDYPIEEVGGMDRVLQVAGDILTHREQLAKPPQTQNVGLGAIIRDKVWRGITNQSIEESNSPEDSEEDSEDETETENDHSQATSISRSSNNSLGWGSYLKTTVVRGITNESAMDSSPGTSPLPSPVSSPQRSVPELSPQPSSEPAPEEKSSSLLSAPSTGSGLWGYAEKLRQSDVAAKLAKARSNLSAKALDAWSARSAPAHDVPIFEEQREESVAGTATGRRMAEHAKEGFRHGSVPNIDRSEIYSPPPRPAYFKPPRDTRLFTPEEINSLAILGSPESSSSSLSTSTLSAGGHNKAESLTSVFPSWSVLQPKSPKPKSAPKPLLLSAPSFVASSTSSHISRSANSTPTPRDLDWSEVTRNKVVPSPRHRDSQLSQTSMSSRSSNPTASPRDAKSGWDSDPSVSRIVRLNRQSISPMAPAFRTSRIASRNTSISSQSEFGVRSYKTASESSPTGANGRLHDEETRARRSQDRVSPDSPSTLPSSPPPRTPVTNNGLSQSSVRVASTEKQRGSLVLSESGISSLDPPPQGKKAHRKPLAPTVETVGDTSDSSIPPASPLNRSVPRTRTKRFNGAQTRPLSLRTQDANVPSSPISIPRTSPSSLAAPDVDSEQETATTPRATHFPATSPTDGHARSPRRRKAPVDGPERRRKLSGETNGTHTQKIPGCSRPGRVGKASGEGHVKRDSHADDGDDEGYDELLSAYESEASRYESASSEA